uniref:Cilia- and flagella-associated protein 157 n=1 Tax=Strongyloides papillosus TaxID=174720 RepID=A0A0N5BZK5_STREA
MSNLQPLNDDELFVEVVKKAWENMSATVGKLNEDFSKLQRKKVPYSELETNFSVDLTGVDHLYDLSRDEICQLYQQEKISNDNKTRTNEMLTRRKNELEDRLAVAETICNVQKSLINRLNDTLGEMFKSLSEHEASRIQKAREWKNKVVSLEGTVTFFTNENNELRGKVKDLMDSQWKKDKELLDYSNKLLNEEGEKRNVLGELNLLKVNHEALKKEHENLQIKYNESMQKNVDVNQASSRIQKIDLEKQTCIHIIEAKELEFDKRLKTEKGNIEKEANKQMSHLQRKHAEEMSKLRNDTDRVLNEAALTERSVVKERDMLSRRLSECESILENHEKVFSQKFQRQLANKYCEIVTDLQQGNVKPPRIETGRSTVPSRYAETCLGELRGEPLSRVGTSSSKGNERREKLREIFNQVIEPRLPPNGGRKRSSSATSNMRR